MFSFAYVILDETKLVHAHVVFKFLFNFDSVWHARGQMN